MNRESCGFCGSFETKLYLNDIHLLYCFNCKIIFLSKKFVINNLKEYYGQNDVWFDRIQNSESLKKITKNAQVYLKLITPYIYKQFKLVNLLDIGTHEGVFVKESTFLGINAIGIEPNKKMVGELQKRNIKVYENSIENFCTEKKFDIITMFHVLEHVSNPKETIKKVYNLLVDNGLFILEVPNIESYLALNHQLSWKYLALEHLFYFSPDTLNNLLSQNGFKALKIIKRNFEIEYFSLNYIFQYLFPTKQNRDRFFIKKTSQSSLNLPLHIYIAHNFIKKMGLKKFLSRFVNFVGRGDHLFVIARKL